MLKNVANLYGQHKIEIKRFWGRKVNTLIFRKYNFHAFPLDLAKKEISLD